MNGQIKLWLDKEIEEMQTEIQKLNHRVMKKVPIWMIVSIGVMIAIGLLAGYDFLYILKVHFVIGCVIAFFIWLCFYCQTKTTSIKKVRNVYEKALEKEFKNEKVAASFNKQIKDSEYDCLNFQNPSVDKYPSRFLIGENYLLYFRYPNCSLIKLDDIDKIYLRRDTANISYNVGNRNIHQNVSVGVSLIVSKKNDNEDVVLSFGNESQVEKVKELIKKYIDDSEELFS